MLSPLLANLYLNELDHLMAAQGYQMIRYADDLPADRPQGGCVVLCKEPHEAQQALQVIQQWTEQAGLILHPTKTRIVNAQTEGFEFLGYRFENGRKTPRKKSLDRLKDTIRTKTRRSSGKSLKEIISELNRTLRGWFAYFKHSHRWTFRPLDKWLRRRLRLILRRRIKRGRGQGRSIQDHQRWPNVFFAENGLYSLWEAYRSAAQAVKTAPH